MIKVYIPRAKNKAKELFSFEGAGERAARWLAERYPNVIYFFEEVEETKDA